MVSRILDLLFIRPTGPGHQRRHRSGWLTAAMDTSLGPVLTAVHRNPGHEWSVNKLGRFVTRHGPIRRCRLSTNELQRRRWRRGEDYSAAAPPARDPTQRSHGDEASENRVDQKDCLHVLFRPASDRG